MRVITREFPIACPHIKSCSGMPITQYGAPGTPAHGRVVKLIVPENIKPAQYSAVVKLQQYAIERGVWLDIKLLK